MFLKQLFRYPSLNHNIYIPADPTPVDIDNWIKNEIVNIMRRRDLVNNAEYKKLRNK